MSEMDIETPGEDAAEQAREVVEEHREGELREVPLDVNEADAAEQEREVAYDEDDDDYR